MSSLTECAPVSPDYTITGTDHSWRGAWTGGGLMWNRGLITPFPEVISGFESSSWFGTTCHSRRKTAHERQRCCNRRQQHPHSSRWRTDEATTLTLTPVETRLLVRISKEAVYLKGNVCKTSIVRETTKNYCTAQCFGCQAGYLAYRSQIHLLADAPGVGQRQALDRSAIRAVLPERLVQRPDVRQRHVRAHLAAGDEAAVGRTARLTEVQSPLAARPAASESVI